MIPLCYLTRDFKNYSLNHCLFLSCLHDASCAYANASGRLSSLPSKVSEQNLPLYTLSDLNSFSAFSFFRVLPAPPFLLIGVLLGFNLRQSGVLCDSCGPPCFLHRVHCLSPKPTCLDFLGMWELIDSILHLHPYSFGLITLGGLASTCTILDLLMNQQESPSIDWSCFLCEVVLGLPLGWTHVQQVHARLVSSKGNTCLVAGFALGL